eukprot:Blabericola_migrator_1__206@NODE_1054_length_5578_cov_25_802395_g596_i1_p2_GENE_NODE_1054_length_5578_cov_25_802395_g596_i1NODE_1054_length_5578_cov_25_802395_g596_i1_p2_ORF_typecomplete_len364_score64_51RNA_pol_Rpc34/PF05158_12/1_1e40_NODE_1054_length_5578_cov_25_802395_g596_i138014892
MSDVVTPDDLKKAYSMGTSNPRKELSLLAMIAEMEITHEKATGIMTRLVQTKAATPIRRVPNTNDCICNIREYDLVKKLQEIKDGETYLVYTCVEEIGSAGISTRDLSRSVNDKLNKRGVAQLDTARINKCLKLLEASKVIKQIKSIHHKGRKLYIVANLEADTSVVGGVFYRQGEFDEELVEGYRDRILQFVTSHGSAKFSDIVGFVKSSGFREDLNEQDLDRVFHTLVLDQLLLSTVHPQTGEIVYSVARWPDLEEFERIPCVSCPMSMTCQIEDLDRFDAIMLRQALTATDKSKEAKQLREGLGSATGLLASTVPDVAFTSKVTPSTCPYMSQWLGLGAYEPCVPKPAETTTTQTSNEPS